jgi:hypothetical protein
VQLWAISEAVMAVNARKFLIVLMLSFLNLFDLNLNMNMYPTVGKVIFLLYFSNIL